MYREAKLDQAQLDDLRQRVHPYIGHLAIGRRVNPREVKRFVNAYTLQTLIRPQLNPDTILALQTLSFRYDWQILYDIIFADPTLFVQALRRYRQDDDSAFEELSPDLRALPSNLASYLRSPYAKPLTLYDSLDIYLSSLQATRDSGSWLYDAFASIGKLRNEIKSALSQEQIARAVSDPVAAVVIEAARSISTKLPGTILIEDSSRISGMLERILTLAFDLTDSASDADDDELRPRMAELDEAVKRLYRDLHRMRDVPFRPPPVTQND
jgi:hypothetical protein